MKGIRSKIGKKLDQFTNAPYKQVSKEVYKQENEIKFSTPLRVSFCFFYDAHL